MITSMRGCVAYNDPWPWPISSRSFGLGLENRVRSVASTVPDGFFPYLVEMITGMRRCVACNDLWLWPIFSKSFGLDLENRVCSVASTVLDGFFPYLVQMITSMRRCVACDDLWPWPISSRSFDLVLTWDPTWLNSVGNHEAAGGILRTTGVLVVLVYSKLSLAAYHVAQLEIISVAIPITISIKMLIVKTLRQLI